MLIARDSVYEVLDYSKASFRWIMSFSFICKGLHRPVSVCFTLPYSPLSRYLSTVSHIYSGLYLLFATLIVDDDGQILCLFVCLCVICLSCNLQLATGRAAVRERAAKPRGVRVGDALGG